MLVLKTKLGQSLAVGGVNVRVEALEPGRVRLALSSRREEPIAFWQLIGESFAIGAAELRVTSTASGKAKFCIEAPPEVAIVRSNAIRRLPLIGAA
jgi:sRNA-binding carbon storage regulator CsrA